MFSMLVSFRKKYWNSNLKIEISNKTCGKENKSVIWGNTKTKLQTKIHQKSRQKTSKFIKRQNNLMIFFINSYNIYLFLHIHKEILKKVFFYYVRYTSYFKIPLINTSLWIFWNETFMNNQKHMQNWTTLIYYKNVLWCKESNLFFVSCTYRIIKNWSENKDSS